jgi:hypothetical protein
MAQQTKVSTKAALLKPWGADEKKLEEARQFALKQTKILNTAVLEFGEKMSKLLTEYDQKKSELIDLVPLMGRHANYVSKTTALMLCVATHEMKALEDIESCRVKIATFILQFGDKEIA